MTELDASLKETIHRNWGWPERIETPNGSYVLRWVVDGKERIYPRSFEMTYEEWLRELMRRDRLWWDD